MYSLENLYGNLRKYSDFTKEGNPENFLNTVDEIVKKQDPSSIGILLSFFEDESEYDWIFQSTSKAIEHYPMECYIDQLLFNLPNLLKGSPVWADNIFNRIFNQPAYLNYFKKNILKTSKDDLFKLFNIMDKESPHHKELISELRKELKYIPS